MKIAIATDDKIKIADRFGRGAGFMIIDTENGTRDYIDNSANADMGHGAGIQTSKLVAETGVEAIIGPHFGPSAFVTLQQIGIRIFYGSGEIEQAITDLEAGKLEEVAQANVPNHHGNCNYK
ncbi:NifB/NifX family molybdenum-iron cluster-binding protein [bacterium]|nr:NifB/NifX family molybdenum-iron cluster-binding protein [bacterium]